MTEPIPVLLDSITVTVNTETGATSYEIDGKPAKIERILDDYGRDVLRDEDAARELFDQGQTLPWPLFRVPTVVRVVLAE